MNYKREKKIIREMTKNQDKISEIVRKYRIKKYKVIVKRKYIYIKPTPREDIKGGLWIIFGSYPELPAWNLPTASADIKKGQNKYERPVLPKGVKIIEAGVL